MENGEFQKTVIESLTRLETQMVSVGDKQIDHEKRIRFLEKGIWIAIGIIVIAEVILRAMVKWQILYLSYLNIMRIYFNG